MRTVQRAYLIDSHFSGKRRVLVRGPFVFAPDIGGWRQTHETERLVFLPGTVPYADWFDGWWGSNWRLPDWGWLWALGRDS